MYIPDLLLLSLIKRKLFACSSDVHKFVAKIQVCVPTILSSYKKEYI